MDNSIQMARSKRRRKDMLLVTREPRLPIGSSTRRDKRKKSTATNRGAKDRKIKASSAESKIGAEVKDFNGSSSKQQRYRSNDKNRKQNRGAEREDKTTRRSSKDLAIEWIGDFCPDDKPHNLIGKHIVYGGSLFKCSNCHKHIWLPNYIQEAAKLDRLIDTYDVTDGYCRFLDKHSDAKVLVIKLQNLWYARKRIKNDIDFAKLVVSVMEDKDYEKTALLQRVSAGS